MKDLTPEGLENCAKSIDKLRLEILIEGNAPIIPGNTGFTPEAELLILNATSLLEQASLSIMLAVIKQRQALAHGKRGSL